jgi:predicted PurR-regulated permease PerM
VQLLDSRTVRILTTICVFIAVGALLYGIRRTLVLFLFAIFFAYLLEPLVTRIQTSPLARHSRRLAIAETYVALGFVLGVLAFFFGPQLVKDTRSLVQSMPNLLENVTSGKIVWQFGNNHGWSNDTQVRIDQIIQDHRQDILNWIGQLGAGTAQFLANAVWFALIPVLAVFFLAGGRHFAEIVICAFDRGEQQRFLRALVADLDRMLSGFILAQLLLGGCAVVAYSSFLLLMHFPYALALGLAGGIMEFVPVAGPLMAAAMVLGVGFLTGYPHLWAVLLFLGAWRLCADYIVTPRVYGRGLQLHPLAAIAAVLAGGELGGILGVYLAIPIAAAIRVVWERWQAYSDRMEAVDATRVQQLPAVPRKTALR